MSSSADRCARADEPAHASAATRTLTPASAAASTVETTQQSVDKPVELRIRRLQRERPLLVVLPPRTGRSVRRDEPGEGDGRLVRRHERRGRREDLGETGRRPGAARRGEHVLQVDDDQMRHRATGPGAPASRTAAGAPLSCRRTVADVATSVTTNPTASATSTPRLAYAHA